MLILCPSVTKWFYGQRSKKNIFSKFLYNIIEVSIVAYILMDFKAKRIYIGRVALMKVVTLSFRYRVAKPLHIVNRIIWKLN